MKKTILLFTAIFMMCLVKAASVNQAEAINMAAALLKTDDLHLEDLAGKYGVNNIYAVSGESCFVLLSADDRAFPVLAYSFETPFGLDLPENARSWIEAYDNGIQSLKAHQVDAAPEVKQAWADLRNGSLGPELNRNEVGPLIVTQWDQRAPYNNYCPSGCVTGCVATAMAQIMKYWEYPNRGTGSHTYTHPIYGSLSANFGNTTYDWDNMPNGANASSPAAVQQALGTLLYHCGVAFEMNYGGDASSAPSAKVPDAMVNYFGYSSSISLTYKNNGYTDASWKAMLKNELEALRPMYYVGQNGNDAHAFVCDGYDSRDYFHFNWGWSGRYNGYYMIGRLNPYAEESYNENNYVIRAIEPLPVSVSAPFNLIAVVSGSNVQLRWNAASGASYYKVYRDGEQIAATVTGLTYVDASPGPGRHCYYVKGISSSGDRSRRSNVAEAVLEIELTPTAISMCMVRNNTVELWWDKASSSMGHLSYGVGGSASDSYGYGGDAPTYWAQRYPASMLAEYNGMGVEMLELYFKYVGTYTVFLCKGSIDGVYETITQQSFTIDEVGYQDIYIDEPFLLDVTKDLWVVLYAPASIPYPVAYCSYNGFGLTDASYISSDFSSWESCSGDHVSWKIQVALTDRPYSFKVIKNGYVIIDNTHDYPVIDNHLSVGTHRYQLISSYNGVESLPSDEYVVTLVNVDVLVSGAGTVEGDGFALEGYTVTLKATPSFGYSFIGWRENGAMISTNPELSFSARSRQLEACFTGVGVEENAETMFEVYPNPILSQFHVESQSVIRKMEIVNLKGEVVEAKDVDAVSLDYFMEGYAKGLYLLRLVTDEGVFTKKVLLGE